MGNNGLHLPSACLETSEQISPAYVFSLLMFFGVIGCVRTGIIASFVLKKKKNRMLNENTMMLNISNNATLLSRDLTHYVSQIRGFWFIRDT